MRASGPAVATAPIGLAMRVDHRVLIAFARGPGSIHRQQLCGPLIAVAAKRRNLQQRLVVAFAGTRASQFHLHISELGLQPFDIASQLGYAAPVAPYADLAALLFKILSALVELVEALQH